MKILGINTATNDLSIALIDDATVLATRLEEGPTARTEQLIPWIQELLESSGLEPQDLEGIGIAQGPGAFTGLRVGVTTAKTFAQMLDIPLAGISTIRAYAEQCIDIPGITSVRIVLKACRGEYNTGLFTILNKLMTQVEEDHPMLEADLWSKVRDERSTLIGDIPAEFAERSRPIRPDAVSIARLAQVRILKGDIDDPRTLVPVYSHGANIKLSPRIHGDLIKEQAAQQHGH